MTSPITPSINQAAPQPECKQQAPETDSDFSAALSGECDRLEKPEKGTLVTPSKSRSIAKPGVEADGKDSPVSGAGEEKSAAAEPGATDSAGLLAALISLPEPLVRPTSPD